MEEYTITRITPEMFGYKDRGLLKWQGMFLADHTDALNKLKKEATEVEAKEEMSEMEISQTLHKAFTMNLPVAIQANVIRNGQYYKDVQCKIAGYSNGRIFLHVKDGRKTSCTIEEIRNVEMMDQLDWYGKLK